MSDNIPNHRDHFKAIAVNTQGTPTQKLLAILADVGITDTAELVEITGLTARAIQLAKRNVLREADFAAKPISAKPTSHAKPTSPEAKSVSLARVEDTYFPSLQEDSSVEVSTPLAPQAVEQPKPKAKRGSRLADDWSLPDDWRDWTRTNCPASTAETVSREATKFANHWQAKPGAQACKLNWFKTWQNWCLTAFGTGPARANVVQAADWREARKARAQSLLEDIRSGAFAQ